MDRLLLVIANWFRPDLTTVNGAAQVAGVADIFGFLYTFPLVIVGCAWLAVTTDVPVLTDEWPLLCVLLLLVLLLDRAGFFIHMDYQGLSVSAEGSLGSVAAWSGALLLGPSALWLPALLRLVRFAIEWQHSFASSERWRLLRKNAQHLASTIPTGLFALALYERWGGTFPLASLSIDAMLPALYSSVVWSVLSLLVFVPFLLYAGTRTVRLTEGAASVGSLVLVVSVGMVLPAFAAPFGILAAGLYAQNGLAAFLFFFSGLLMGSLLARQLSRTVERSRQRSRELERLEQLGQAIISAPPDGSTLPQLLQEHVPSMFPFSQIEIRRFPDHVLLRFPKSEDLPLMPDSVWDWLGVTQQACYIPANQPRPWNPTANAQHNVAQASVVIAPVMGTDAEEVIGGVYVIPERDIVGAASLLPAVQSLAAQISSALRGARDYRQTLLHQRVEQELALAGEIQARFLPKSLPDVPGWQLAATLDPARQTSGDFYDVIALPNGRLGMLVADVADKGTGAALYMALSSTLLRTYAVEHHMRPDFALRVANNRILADTELDLFVTVFYAILDPLTGTLTYCNAGHNPPLLLRGQTRKTVERLTKTGIPLGIFRGQTWEQRTVQLTEGDVLVLYTDGITEAQNHQQAFFGEDQLIAVTQAHCAETAQVIKAAVMQQVRAFVGDAPQFDDIALLVLVREAQA